MKNNFFSLYLFLVLSEWNYSEPKTTTRAYPELLYTLAILFPYVSLNRMILPL
jgi:hypothetical protein